MAKRQSDTTPAVDTADNTPAADTAADTAPAVDTADILPAPAPDASGVDVSPEAAAVLALEAALAALPDGNPARPALEAALAEAVGAQALAEAEAARQAERANAESAAIATAAAANLPQAVLDRMLAAIAEAYDPAPAPEATPDAPATLPETARRQVSDRALALNAAAASDTAAQGRAGETVAAFDVDSGRLACTVNRRPNTRFSGMVALTPSGGGVANYADYDTLTRAIRAYLINVKRWQVSESDGQSVPEAKWLASRGRYILGGGVKSALACFHSGAEIALYPDGRFRFALPNTPQVRYLRTDNAAWQAFVGGTASAAPAAAPATPDAPAAPVSTPIVPTPPNAITLPSGGLATTARCQHCQKRNIVGSAVCEQCDAADWHVS